MFSQLSLPTSRKKAEGSFYSATQGRLRLTIQAEEGMIPSGSLAQTFILRTFDLAYRQKSRILELPKSFSGKLKLIGRTPSGKSILGMKRALDTLGKAKMTFYWDGVPLEVFEEVSSEKITFSSVFFDTACRHAFPVSAETFKAVSGSIYQQRYLLSGLQLHHAAEKKSQAISIKWKTLWQRLGTGFKRAFDFKRHYRKMLPKICAIAASLKIHCASKKVFFGQRPPSLEVVSKNNGLVYQKSRLGEPPLPLGLKKVRALLKRRKGVSQPPDK